MQEEVKLVYLEELESEKPFLLWNSSIISLKLMVVIQFLLVSVKEQEKEMTCTKK